MKLQLAGLDMIVSIMLLASAFMFFFYTVSVSNRVAANDLNYFSYIKYYFNEQHDVYIFESANLPQTIMGISDNGSCYCNISNFSIYNTVNESGRVIVIGGKMYLIRLR